MKSKKIIIVIVCSLCTTVINSCSKSGGTGGGGGTGGTTIRVDIGAMTFSPATVTVKAGTTVKWTNTDYYSPHTITADNGSSFNSGNIASGSSFSYTPAAAGTFPYHCNVHSGMTGTLVVTN